MASLLRLLPLTLALNLAFLLGYLYLTTEPVLEDEIDITGVSVNAISEDEVGVSSWMKGVLDQHRKKVGDFFSSSAGGKTWSGLESESTWLSEVSNDKVPTHSNDQHNIDERFCRLCRNDTLCEELG